MRTIAKWTFRGGAVGAAFLASVQPVLGSFSFFRGGSDWGQAHLAVGGILYNLAILLAVLAPFTGFRRRWQLFSVSLVQYALVHVQLRLGLGSRADVGLLAYHVPLGVLIFALAYLVLALSFGTRVDPGRA